jgi:hypothetical protein
MSAMKYSRDWRCHLDAARASSALSAARRHLGVATLRILHANCGYLAGARIAHSRLAVLQKTLNKSN